MTKLKKTLPNDLARFCMNHERDWCEPIIEKLKEMLSECEPDATTRGGNKYTVLHYTNIPVEIVAWQIERGATVDAPHTYGTPLFAHARKGNFDICKLLIEKGADVNAENYENATPLFAAADGGKVEVIKLLLENGADPNHRGNSVVDGKNALLFMIPRMIPGDGDKAEIAEILIDALGGKEAVSEEDWKLAQKYIRDKGEKLEFAKSGWGEPKDDWERNHQAKAKSEMQKFYELFDVEPAKPIVKHDGKSPIIVDKSLSVGELHDALWDYLVPSRGACATVQGEVIRITGRIGDEVYRNGGMNWDGEYRKMLAALKDYFAMGTPLPEENMAEVRNASLGINKCKACGCENDVCKLQVSAVRWVSLNSTPIPLGSVDYNR